MDVPAAAGPEQRIFLEGDQQIYARGGVMGELRDPFLRVCSSNALVKFLHTKAMSAVSRLQEDQLLSCRAHSCGSPSKQTTGLRIWLVRAQFEESGRDASPLLKRFLKVTAQPLQLQSVPTATLSMLIDAMQFDAASSSLLVSREQAL